MTGMSAERKQHLAIEARDKKMQGALNQSMLALILFLAGFCFLYFWALEPDGYEAMVSKGMIALGFPLVYLCPSSSDLSEAKKLVWISKLLLLAMSPETYQSLLETVAHRPLG